MDRHVGPYRLTETLGTLPFGELVAATHAARSEALAVLLLTEPLGRDHRLRGLLRLEVARASGLRHPALARTIEVGEHANAPYLVVERPAGGRMLAQVLADGPPLEPTQAMVLVQRLAEGLDAAHSRRLPHGALSPDAVFVGADGGASVLGLGLAAAIDEAGLRTVVDPPPDARFVAPEQRGGRLAVASADGYSLGVLAGLLLAHAGSAGAGDGAVLATPGPANAVSGRAAVAAVLARQTAADPAARYSTCVAFAAALSEATETLTDAAPTRAPNALEAPPSGRSVTRPLAAPPSTPATSLSASTSVPAPQFQPPPAPPPAPPILLARPLPVPVPPQSPLTGRPPQTPPGRETAPPLDDAPAPDQTASDTDGAHTVTNTEPTAAMLACLARIERRDVLTDGLNWVASAFPPVERALATISKDGKIGPFPAGTVLVVALALLLLLVRQVWPATVLVAALLALQWLPRLVTRLTASEWASPEAVQVAGPARLRRRLLDPFGEAFELVLANGMVLNLQRNAYEQLLRASGAPASDGPAARPEPVSLPVVGTVHVAPRSVDQPLPAVSVTYLSTRRLLFAVRAADGTVLLRHPEYDGEPGDRPRVTPPLADAPLEVNWRPAGRGRVQTLPLPAPVQAALQTAYTSAQARVVVQVGLPLALIAFTITSSLLPFASALAIGAFFLWGGPPFTRANQLRSARTARTLVRVNGPVRLTEHRMGKTQRFTLHLENGTTLPIDFTLRNLLARLGTRANGGDWTAHVGAVAGFGPEQLVSEDDVPALTVAYEPTAPFLLEVYNPFGASVYRDPALAAGMLGEPPVTA